MILEPKIQTDTTMAEARNWADLPRDILHLIYTKLPPDLRYFVIFRSVCKDWRDFDSLNEPPPKFPWLLECKTERHFGDGGECLQQNLRYYSLATGETRTIRVPESFHGKYFHGPGHGYLLVSSCQKLCLLNPLTGDIISLPPLDYGFKTLWPVCGSSDPVHNWHIVSGFPSESRIWGWRSAIYHHNEKKWTYVDDNSCNTCCSDRRLYTTWVRYCTKVYDAVSGEKLDDIDIEPPEEENFGAMATYLIECGQEILRVTWFLDFTVTEKAENSKFLIYKLKSEEGEGQNRWVKASDIGDQILFLDVMNGFSTMAPAGFKGNCIYFLDIEDGSNKPYRYDIGTSTVERLPCPFNSCTWFIPSLG